MRDLREIMSELCSSGLTTEQHLLVLELTAAVARSTQPIVDRTADKRRAWDRQRKRKAPPVSTGIPPDPVEMEVSPSKEVPQTPKETQPLQVPPIPPKGGFSPTRISPSKAEIDGLWEATPKLGRERSSRKDLERSLTAAMRRGHDPTDMLTGIIAAYASPSFSGDHAKGVHRLIENDRWQSFTEDIDAAPSGPSDEERAVMRQRMTEFYQHRREAGNA